MLSIIAALPLVSTALASQHILWDGAGLPNPNLWNRTCKDDDENALLVISGHPACPIHNNNATTKPIIKPGPSPYGPWTEVSDCIHAANESEVFCVFISATFANNRGLSVFTTPAVAEHMAQRLAFTKPELLKGVNAMPNPPYSVQALPGRGLGVIANATIFRGEKLMLYTPVLMVNRRTIDVFQNDDRFPFQTMAVDRLPPRTRDLFYSMHAQFGEDPVEDIIDTNSFQVDLGPDNEPHGAVLPETARMNHDCRPNTQYYFDPHTLTHHTHALRTIQPGEEVTDTYTDITVSREKRQAALKHSWGFDCTCSLCRQPEIMTRESDRRLEMISDLDKILSDWSDPENSVATPEMAETMVSLCEQERLHGYIARAYSLAALAYCAAGQEQNTIRYAALALERSLLNYGPYFSDVQIVRDLMNGPTRHWTWKYRVRKAT